MTTPPAQFIVFWPCHKNNTDSRNENLTHDHMLKATRHHCHTADTQSIAMRQILLAQNAFMSKHICISGWATWIMVPLPLHLPAAFYHFNWKWYMCEDQVAGKRTGGVSGLWRGGGGGVGEVVVGVKATTSLGYDPQRPASACLTTAGDWDDTNTHILHLEMRLGGTACVHSLLMTDMLVKCDKLVKLSVTYGLHCENRWTTFQNTSSAVIVPSCYCNRQNKWIEPIQCALHAGTSNYKSALLCALLWENQDNYCKGQLVIKSSSTIFNLQIHCHAPWCLPLVLCWCFESIRGVLVNFVSAWMKRRKLSVKRPLWLCI